MPELSLPLQQFWHSTNLYRTHDHQIGEALQVYLTYIATVLLKTKNITQFLKKYKLVKEYFLINFFLDTTSNYYIYDTLIIT